MKILITGASGSIGKTLIPILIKQYNILCLGKTKVNIKDVTNIFCDFNEKLDKLYLPNDIDVIIHLAQSNKFRDFPNSAEHIYNVNVRSTLFLADFAKSNNIRKFIYASSGGIYGNRNFGFTETDNVPVDDLGFYLGSKLCSEIILDNYKEMFDVVLLRLFFVFGKDQSKNMLIPRLINNIKKNNKIIIDKSGGIKINPIYVNDAVASIIESIKLEGSHKINVAGNEILSIKDISEKIAKKLGLPVKYNISNILTNNLIGDNTKMRERLYEPSYSFDSALDEIIISEKD